MRAARRAKWKPPPLPREHGAWAMLVLPLILGSLAAGSVTAASAAILPATVLLFLARFAAVPGGTRVKTGAPGRFLWTGLYLTASGLGLALAVGLAAPTRRPEAILLAVVTGVLGLGNAGLVLAGAGRALAAEAVAMGAVAATAPLAMVLAGAPLDRRAIGVGVVCYAYFLSTLAFVRSYRAVKDPGTRRAAVAACLAAHGALGAALLAVWRAGAVGGWLLLPFAPVVARTVWGLARPAPHLRALGWRELGVAAVFLAVAGVVLLSGAA